MNNFKTHSLLHILKLGAKIIYIFCQWNLPLLKKGVTYPAIKVFNNLPSNILKLQENKTLLKSALRKCLLFYSVEKFLVQNDKT